MDPTELSVEQNKLPHWAWIGCVLLVIAAALHSADKPVGGGDTWVAMQCGRFQRGPWPQKDPGRTWQMRLLDKFGVHITKKDPYSAASRDYIPGDKNEFGWVNQNWLTHTLFYVMKSSWVRGEHKDNFERDNVASRGENLIVVYKFLQAILTALFAYWAARVLGVHPVWAAAAAAFGILLSRSFVDLRPNVSTIFFSSIMIFLLACWQKKHNWALLWMIPVMIIDANVHGGFIYPIIIVHLFLGAWVIHNLLNKPRSYWVEIVSLIWLVSLFGVLWFRYFERGPILFFFLVLFGFIVFIIGKLLFAGRPDVFPHTDSRSLLFLLGTAIVVLLIPGIFSPFGWENLEHPFLVATGEEGNIWRDVVEWKPIWDKMGFGNEVPYIYFLVVFGAVFLIKWILFCFKPSQPQSRRRRQRDQEVIPWPKVDLAHLGIIGITIYMSIMSRRFIFLGGVILAPFLALMVQEIADMIRVLREKEILIPTKIVLAILSIFFAVVAGWALWSPLVQITGGKFWSFLLCAGAASVVLISIWLLSNHYFKPKKVAQLLAGATMTAALVVGLIFVLAMQDLYYLPELDGYKETIFRKMVGINDQPVRAIKFFQDNNIHGIVYNEWTNGGFIAFHQKPDSETGQPPCKVFMDGRSQAAYKVEHFEYWRTIKAARAAKDEKFYPEVQQLARRIDLKPTDPKFFDFLLFNASRPIKEYPDRKTYENQRRYFLSMMQLALTDQQLFANLLKRDGINAALLSLSRSSEQFRLFAQLQDWSLVYIDDHNAIFLRNDAPENQKIIRQSPEKLKYPDDFSRNYSLGYIYCYNANPKIVRRGIDYLMATDRYTSTIYNTIFSAGTRLKMYDKLFKYFEQQRRLYQEKVDSKQRFGRLISSVALAHACGMLEQLSKISNKPAEAEKYAVEKKKYFALMDKIKQKPILW